MASIKRTAYPRFKKKLTQKELIQLYSPIKSEINFAQTNARGDAQQLTLLTLLKCHQCLGYIPALAKIPDEIITYLSLHLGLKKATTLVSEAERSRYRYYHLIRLFLKVNPYSKGGQEVVYSTVSEAAHRMSDPADLINAAIEKLIEQRYELPAFSTLNRIVGHIRQNVHQKLYQSVLSKLSVEQKEILNDLLEVQADTRMTGFTHLKFTPGRPTLKQMNIWVKHYAWLSELINTTPLLSDITHTKIEQFAAQASQMELQDVRDVLTISKRYTLLICLIHQKQVHTKDQLVEMFTKRMKRTKNRAEEKLQLLKEQNREVEEQMLAAFSEVLDKDTRQTSNTELGKRVRIILSNYGGTELLQNRYKQVSDYHNNNYFPLLWDVHRAHRAALFRLLKLLSIQSTTQDTGLLDALQFVLDNQSTRKDHLDYEIALDFLPHRWKQFVEAKQTAKGLLDRRALEVAVLAHVADGLKSTDLFVSGSEKYADYRKQLLSLEECEKRIGDYCSATGISKTAAAFVTKLKQELTTAAQQADDRFLSNEALSIDDHGKPHLKRNKTKSLPQGLKQFKETVRENMPERSLLDILKHVQYWINYTRHFTPPSGSDAKLKNAIQRYLFTIFGYGCNLGATQTAKHTKGVISSRVLRRINHQHITTNKLESAFEDVINEYNRFDLPFIWGDGSAMIVDGTHIELIENNLFGEHHIRYGGYGGIAYHYISDTYIALFSRFIACGVWEAIHILDGLLANNSELQPDTVHADTQGQSQPVFALSYLMGIQLMPRMRNWDDVYFFRPDKDISYQHIEELFTKTPNWKLIETHWKDMMQVVLSIQAGKVLPSMLLRKLGVRSRKNKLYLAFRELGRVVRTIFLLKYISDPEMRQHIQGATTKVETYHYFCDWISFGGKVTTSGDPIEQEKRVKYMNLIANIIMLHNVVDLTNVLRQMNQRGETVTLQLIERLSPYMTKHIRRFGEYHLDLENMPEPLEIQKLDFI